MTWTPTTGIVADRRGYRAWVWVNGRNLSKRFPPGTPIALMAAWRLTAKASAPPRPRSPAPTGLAADVEAYLAAVAGMPSIRQRRAMLRHWRDTLGPTRDRRTVTPTEISTALARLRDRYAASTVNMFRTALSDLYRRIDPDWPNPVRQARRMTPPDAAPRGLSLAVVAALLDYLPDPDLPRQTRNGRRAAQLIRVFAMTGLPPATIHRLRPEHLARLADHQILAPGRLKGHGTRAQVRAVTPEGAAELARWRDGEMWGAVSDATRKLVWDRAVARVRAARPDLFIPADCDCYRLRHAYGELVYRACGHDLALVAAFLGHADLRTTRRYAAGAIPEGEAAAAAAVSAYWRAAAARAGQDKRTPPGAATDTPGAPNAPEGR